MSDKGRPDAETPPKSDPQVQALKARAPVVPAPPAEPPAHHTNLDDFSGASIRRIIRSTRWFLTAAVAGISIELVVQVVEHLEGFEFIAFLLHWLSRMVLVCDLLVYALYVVIEFMLTVETLLKAVGVDIRKLWRDWRACHSEGQGGR